MTSRASDVHPSTHGLSLFLVLMFTLQLLAPVVSAAGMQSCGGGDNCDTYDHDEDLTPNVQDWVEGMYEFDLVSTSSIDLELTWAVREFDRDSIGLGSGSPVGDTLEDFDGLDANDGAPADLIRETFDMSIGGTTVGEKLKTEIDVAIRDALESGFGTVNSLSTQFVDSFSNPTSTIDCSTDNGTDSFA